MRRNFKGLSIKVHDPIDCVQQIHELLNEINTLVITDLREQTAGKLHINASTLQILKRCKDHLSNPSLNMWSSIPMVTLDEMDRWYTDGLTQEFEVPAVGDNHVE